MRALQKIKNTKTACQSCIVSEMCLLIATGLSTPEGRMAWLTSERPGIKRGLLDYASGALTKRVLKP